MSKKRKRDDSDMADLAEILCAALGMPNNYTYVSTPTETTITFPSNASQWIITCADGSVTFKRVKQHDVPQQLQQQQPAVAAPEPSPSVVVTSSVVPPPGYHHYATLVTRKTQLGDLISSTLTINPPKDPMVRTFKSGQSELH
jgi:hypothetical protein